jgi:CheY-like chemotaxis protein
MKRNYLIVLLLAIVCFTIPSLQVAAQSADSSSSSDLAALVLIALVLVLLLALPVIYMFSKQTSKPKHGLLFVSTDEAVFPMVKNAARHVGYNAITVYRYEDALDRLRQDTTLTMIIVDDSVPQYETGLLLSMLQNMPIGIRPLILIHDSSELGQTAPSYRAEALVSKPVTEKALEAAIRQVHERIEPLLM